MSFRLTKVQLPFTARLARTRCTVEQVLMLRRAAPDKGSVRSVGSPAGSLESLLLVFNIMSVLLAQSPHRTKKKLKGSSIIVATPPVLCFDGRAPPLSINPCRKRSIASDQPFQSSPATGNSKNRPSSSLGGTSFSYFTPAMSPKRTKTVQSLLVKLFKTDDSTLWMLRLWFEHPTGVVAVLKFVRLEPSSSLTIRVGCSTMKVFACYSATSGILSFTCTRHRFLL